MCYLRDRITTKIENNEYDKRVIGEIVSTMKSSFNIFKRFNLLSIDIVEEYIEAKYFNDYELLWEFGLYNMINTIPSLTTRYQWRNMNGDLMYGFEDIVYDTIMENQQEIVDNMSEFYNNIPTSFISINLDNFKYRMLVNNRVLPKQLQEEIKINFKTDIQNRLDKREEQLETCQEDLEILDTMKSYELFPNNQTDLINDKIITQLKQTDFNGRIHTNSDNYKFIKFCNKIFKYKNSVGRKSQLKINTICYRLSEYNFYVVPNDLGDSVFVDDRMYIKKIYDEFGEYRNFEFTEILPPYEGLNDIRSRY